jgi:hypothetical protein
MKVCGIELKGSDAVIVCLEGSKEDCNLICKDQKKFSIKDSNNQLDVSSFSSAIGSFLEENEFDEVGIKARATKGRFAGGSVSFKMEGIIQLCNVNVEVIHGATIKSKLKSKNVSITDGEVLAYQKEALTVAQFLIE